MVRNYPPGQPQNLELSVQKTTSKGSQKLPNQLKLQKGALSEYRDNQIHVRTVK